MFFIDDTQASRHAKIRAFDDDQIMIAVLLAAADFEWTVRRAIIGLGHAPNKYIRDVTLKNCSGLKSYKAAWNEQVRARHHIRLADVVPNWQFFKEQAYPLRHRLIHGAQGTTGIDYAKTRIDSMLGASTSVADFALSKDVNIYSRLPVRRKHINV